MQMENTKSENKNIIYNNRISQKSLEETVDDIKKKIDISDSEKAQLIIPAIKKNKSTNQKQIIDCIKEANIQDNNEKFKIIRSFLSLQNESDIVDIIRDTKIDDELTKSKIIQSFVENQEYSQIHQNEIIRILKEVGVNNEYYKSKIIESFLAKFWFSEKNIKSNENPNSVILSLTENATPDNFATIIKDFELQNRVDLIIDLFKYAYQNPQSNDVENFIHIAKSLYSSELMQFELIRNGMKFNGVINSGNLKDLKPFIEDLKDNELALNLIKTLHEKKALQDEKDILSLVKNRSKKQYDFIAKILKDRTLDDSISEDGKVQLKKIFGDDLTVDGEPITISQLISYYDIKKQVSDLSSILKPEFKKQLRDNFLPSSEIFLYKPQELEKLNQLLNEEGVDFDVKTYFIENKKLCDFLRDKVGNIPEIDPEITYQINFKKFSFSEEGQKMEQEQQEINKLFNQILKDSDPDPIMVKDFFTRLLTEFEFPPDEQNKLRIFFVNNKKEIAHCFCGDEKSSEDFKYSLMTIKDGCFANMGMQFRKALYATIIEDEEAQIFYKFADYKIFSAIINQHGEDIITRVEAPFDNKEINLYYLSPMLLISKLAEEESLVPIKSWEIIKDNMGRAFVGQLSQSESLNLQDSWAIIRNNFGDEMASELLEKMMEEIKEPEKIDQKSREIASYFIVKMIVGEDKMQDLESKNPQLKTLRNLIFDRVSEPSPQLSANDNEEDFLINPLQRNLIFDTVSEPSPQLSANDNEGDFSINPLQEMMRQDSLDRRGFSLEFSSIDRLESSPQASPRGATCLSAFSCFRLFGSRGR
jgi:hypothetical protein